MADVGGLNYMIGDTVCVHPSFGAKTFGFVKVVFLGSRDKRAYRLHSSGYRAFHDEDLLVHRIVLTEKYDKSICWDRL